ncbi:MAG: serine hydrolase [Eubacteriales bacterium]|nr:serine hydrolase [Eubacteriales bacterium]
MLKNTMRTGAAVLAAAMLMSQTAFADTVITSSDPSLNYSTTQGPTGSKQLNDKGYLEFDGHNNSTSSFVNAGPGVANGSQSGTQSGAGTQNNPTVTDPNANQGNTAVQNPSVNIPKPEIASEAAILYDATTGAVYFEKNADKAMYPASMTKLMTALLAVENLKLEEQVVYSKTATSNLESGASNIALTEGDKLTVKDSLYALLLKSACEVANGLAEKVSGSQAEFVKLMNNKAKELGCTNTNFENPSGLNGASHYTTARDMALITNAALKNETLKTILMTRSYKLPASKKRSETTITNGNLMINPANKQYVEGIVGGKTGYTSKAGNTFTAGADINGHRLIAVVLKSKQKHYDDTKALFEYGKKVLEAGGNGSVSQNNSSQTSQGAGWIKTADNNWQYKKADGSLCKNEWLDLDGATYFFGSDAMMSKGWKGFTNGAWYYFNPENGAMVKNKWVTDNGKSYYLGSDGVMATNTTINNMYKVDANGVYYEKVG